MADPFRNGRVVRRREAPVSKKMARRWPIGASATASPAAHRLRAIADHNEELQEDHRRIQLILFQRALRSLLVSILSEGALTSMSASCPASSLSSYPSTPPTYTGPSAKSPHFSRSRTLPKSDRRSKMSRSSRSPCCATCEITRPTEQRTILFSSRQGEHRTRRAHLPGLPSHLQLKLWTTFPNWPRNHYSWLHDAFPDGDNTATSTAK